MRTLMRSVALFGTAAALMASSPYSGLEKRSIKALSPERIAALESGSGVGYALAAELNGYPGPRHVLDLADALNLSPAQRKETAALFAEMKRGAVSLGRELMRRAAGLEKLFREGAAGETALMEQTAAIGAADARLRATHLKYHVRMANVLTAAQRRNYNALRGYGHAGGKHGGRHRGGH